MVCIKIHLFQLTFSKCFSSEGTFRAFITLQVSLGKPQTVYSFNIIKKIAHKVVVCIKIQLFQLTFLKCFSSEGTFRAFIPLQVSLGKPQTVYSFNITIVMCSYCNNSTHAGLEAV